MTLEKPLVEVPLKPENKVTVKVTKENFWVNDCIFEHKDTYNKINVNQVIMGCGIAQIHGVADMLGQYKVDGGVLLRDIIKEIHKYYNSSPKQLGLGIGGIICTLGHAYRKGKIEEKLLQCGFKRIAKYRNWRHSGIEYQALYIYKFPKYDKNS